MSQVDFTLKADQFFALGDNSAKSQTVVYGNDHAKKSLDRSRFVKRQSLVYLLAALVESDSICQYSFPVFPEFFQNALYKIG